MAHYSVPCTNYYVVPGTYHTYLWYYHSNTRYQLQQYEQLLVHAHGIHRTASRLNQDSTRDEILYINHQTRAAPGGCAHHPLQPRHSTHLDCLEWSQGELGWCDVWAIGVTMISTVLNFISMGRDWSRVHGICIRNSLINPLRNRSIKQAHNAKQPSGDVEAAGIVSGGMLDASLMGIFGCPKNAKGDADFSAFIFPTPGSLWIRLQSSSNSL